MSSARQTKFGARLRRDQFCVRSPTRGVAHQWNTGTRSACSARSLTLFPCKAKPDMASIANKASKLTDKLVEKIGVQRTPAANPEMYKSDDYSVHLKGHNKTEQQAEREMAEDKAHTQSGGDPAVESSLGFKAT